MRARKRAERSVEMEGLRRESSQSDGCKNQLFSARQTGHPVSSQRGKQIHGETRSRGLEEKEETSKTREAF